MECIYSPRHPNGQYRLTLFRFLLAQLHLDSLIGKRSPKAVRTALKKLPTGSEAYDQAYKEAMERIEGQETDLEDLAKQVLSWITCAKRPLTTSELRHALAVEIGESELDQDNIPEIEDMVSVCAGLVTVDEESDVVRLVHYTTQEYFERTWTSWFSNAQEDIAKTCVTYLSFDDFEAGPCPTDEEFEARLELNPFYEYAARYWGYHVNTASTKVQHSIPEFLENGAKVPSSNQAMMASLEYHRRGHSQRMAKKMTGVHLAAYFGLREMTLALLKNRHQPDIKDSKGRTPLLMAAENGREAVVRLLVERADVEADSKDDYGQTPLLTAAENGREAVVRLLVGRADVKTDLKDNSGQTPLLKAALYGQEAVVRLLVERPDVEADLKDNYGQTPLSGAAENGREAVVRLLVERADVEADSKDSTGRTPLSWAALYGQEAVVRLLVERADVEADSKDDMGRTPLSWAVVAERERWMGDSKPDAVLELLLTNSDVDVNARDTKGRTPLSWAAGEGHHESVKFLLAKTGIDRESKDDLGQTPLEWATNKGHTAVVKLLQPDNNLFS